MPGPFASCSHQISCHCADKLPASRNNGRPDQAKIEGVPLVLTFILAGAKFQIRDYNGTIRALQDAIELEGRTSALMAAIYVSALENNGDHKVAEQFARNFTNTWQPVQFRKSLARLYSNDAEVLTIAGPLADVMARIDSR